ncbi:MAG: cysteine desulfurase-like protein [Anaerolineae bacterium]|nr:cysteine desulfurase-like protein [Anaerolineae bacterium]
MSQFDAQLVRPLFPSLNIPAESGNLPIFFDNPGGTQVPQMVIDAVADVYRRANAIPGGHFATSKRSAVMFDAAHEAMADLFNAQSPNEIVFGMNTTTLNFALAHALGHRLQSGDEIVLTRMDHDANVSPWLRLAQDQQLEVKWADIHTDDCTLDMASLEDALSERTRIVATVHASNAVGTINPVSAIADMAHAVGAVYVMDAVQSVPHEPIDVQAIGCDFLLCSSYKFFGPHLGVMYGRYDLLDTLPAYQVRPASPKPPTKWETGVQSFESINGINATIAYLEQIGELYGEGDFPEYSGRRQVLKRAFAVTKLYEAELAAYLIEGLQSIPGVQIYGITDINRMMERVPTVSFTMEGHLPENIGQYLAERDIYLWTGNYYAIEIMKRLGHSAHGMVRVGLAHYNMRSEIDRLLQAVDELARA